MSKRSLGEESDVGGKRSYTPYGGGTVLKILVPNFMAGKLIGKGGSNIGELQSKFKLSIQVNNSNEFYPGTKDRIVCVTGEGIEGITYFLDYLVDLVETELQSDRINSTLSPEVKIIISHIAAGLIIGKGGEQIKAIVSDSNAKVQVSRKDESVAGERVVTVSGTGEQRSSACKLLMEAMASAPDKISNNNLNYSQPMQMLALNNTQPMNSHYIVPDVQSGVSFLPGAAYNGMNFDYKPKSQYRIKFQGEMEIPGKVVGTVLGRGGQTIKEISSSSGANLQFSKKDEYTDMESSRTLTITGSVSQVHKAYMMVDEKLAQVEAEYGSISHGR